MVDDAPHTFHQEPEYGDRAGAGIVSAVQRGSFSANPNASVRAVGRSETYCRP